SDSFILSKTALPCTGQKKKLLDPTGIFNCSQHIIEKGEENCGHLIEAHKECMRALGFKI
uniref:COX17 oxidase n=1 Tax=Zosterops lateralis melanops TaxID=1220523 RepID=A0A8D2NYS2_ZOSLA